MNTTTKQNNTYSNRFYGIWIVLFCLIATANTNAYAQSRTTTPTRNNNTNKPGKSTTKPSSNSKGGDKATTGTSKGDKIPGSINEAVDQIRARKKAAKPSTPAGNVYQDITAYYNRYFNAKLRYTEGMAKMMATHKDSFATILPVYALAKGSGTSAAGELDAVIKKTSLLVQLKPHSKWVDDSYLLLGKAYFLKGDIEEASKSFETVISEFSKYKRKTYDKREKERLKKDAVKEKADLKKEQAKQKEELLKQREEEKKEREKQREEQKEAREKAKKETEKIKEENQKEREKDKKAREKEREKEKKQREKEKKEREKQRAKEKKQREKDKKSGKKTSTTSKSAKEEKETSEKPAVGNSSKEDIAKPKEKQEDVPKEKEKTKKELEKEKKEREKVEKDKKAEDAAANKEIANLEKELTEAPSSAIKKGYREGALKHKLAKNEALIWLARMYIEKNMFVEADNVIQAIKKDKKFPKRLNGSLNQLLAHYYLERTDYAGAEEALQQALNSKLPKREKARLYFILGQLQQQNADYKGAITAFKKVLRNKPTYDMEFNTHLNILKNNVAKGSYSSTNALAKLDKMTKDNKNDAYKDQIYWTMSEIAMAEGKTDDAMAYLTQSATTSKNNNTQKVAAFLKLAELYYEKRQYAKSGAYYDSAVVVLPKSYKDYETVKTRRDVLVQLAKHTSTIAEQDSLRKIADMSSAARRVFLEEEIARLAALAQKTQQEQQQEFLNNNNNNNNLMGDNPETGQWYFYNTTVLGQGATAFVNRWGNRPLVDNWRLSTQAAMGAVADATTPDGNPANNAEDFLTLANEGKLTVQMLEAALPLSPEAKKNSDSLVIASHYSAGRIYREQLKDYQEALAMFEKLIARFPNNVYADAVYYNMFLAATSANQTAKASEYRNAVLQKYPDSQYAKILKDPNYAQTLAEQNKALERYYEQTYALYKQDKTTEALARIKDVNNQFAENPMQPKFDLLEAFLVGKMQNREAYVSALQGVMQKHPNDEVKNKAQEMLIYLADMNTLPANAPALNDADAYDYKPTSRHYVMVILGEYTDQISILKNQLADFNTANYSTDNLKVTEMLLDPQHQVVLAKDFDNAEKAKLYQKTLQMQTAAVFAGITTPYTIVAISKSNFSKYYKKKDNEEYQQFYLQNYK